MKLNQDEIKTILPHREPMLLVTSVEDLSPGEDIRAVFFADPKMDIFLGHFPEEPILPGVYSIECMAQAVDILLMSTLRYAGKTPLLLGVDKVSFRKRSCRETPLKSMQILFPRKEKKPSSLALLKCMFIRNG